MKRPRRARIRIASGLGAATLLVAWAVSSTSIAPVRAVERMRWTEPQAVAYPETRRVEQVDEYHGVSIADPYRWLESSQSQETRDWTAAQNRLTRDFLDRQSQRGFIRRRLDELWHYSRASIPVRRGGKYFFLRNSSGGTQPVLHVAERLDGPTRSLLDPNRMSSRGDAALSGWRVSRAGRYLAYGLAVAGSDWRTIRVRDIETGRDLPDEIAWVKYSDLAWTHDEAGFFYSRYDVPRSGEELHDVNRFQKLYYHRVGESSQRDVLVHERPDEPDWAFDPEVSDDGRWLVVRVWRGADSRAQILLRDLQDPRGTLSELFGGFDASYRFVGATNEALLFTTDREAPRGKLIAVEVTSLSASLSTLSSASLDDLATRQTRLQPTVRDLLPESDDVLRDANVVGRTIIVRFLREAASRVVAYELDGKRRYELKFAEPSTVEGLAGWSEDPETFFAVTTYTQPTVIYRLDIATGDCSTFHVPRVPTLPRDLEVRQVTYASRDGTRVPMTILARQGLPQDGARPTLLYGYGGFNMCLTPYFSVTNIVWLEMGGVLAVPNVRGGGELGSDWHASGQRTLKQNSIDDFLAAAEWLIEQKYTNPRRLAIGGKSNGGMLVGAALTQRPELFAAAVPGVGVFDMLRYPRFTIGRAWASEYGTAEDPREFRALLAYSPLHNVRRGREYPAMLVATADHDDRVVPAHSYKFVAELQAAQVGAIGHSNRRPVLLRVESQAGHGSGLPADKLLEAATDTLTFLSSTLEVHP